MNWHRKIMQYPANTVVGPDYFHEGPDYLQTGRKGFYVWEDGGMDRPGRLGRWSMLGPFNTREKAEEIAAKMPPRS